MTPGVEAGRYNRESLFVARFDAVELWTKTAFRLN
jgi:hypothetical protein